MANTHVLTLGLGFTFNPPLGSTFELLRLRIQQLRKQGEGAVPGRIIGELIRLGLEQATLRQFDRAMALDRVQQYDDQLARLRREHDEVERLCQQYLRLDRIIAGLTALSPQALTGAWHAPLPMSSAASPALPPSSASVDAPRTPRSNAARIQIAGALVAGGIVAASAGYKVSQSVPVERRRRAAESVKDTWKAGAVNAGVKSLEALLSDDPAQDKAESVGGAAGELGGSLLGAALGARLSKNKHVQEYLVRAGGITGEKLGKKLTGGLFDFLMYEEKAKPIDVSNGQAQKSATPVEQGEDIDLGAQQEEGVAPAQQAVASSVATLGASATVARGVPVSRQERLPQGALDAPRFTSMPSPTMILAPDSHRLGISRGLLKRVPGLSLLDTSLQLADTYSSAAAPQQKLAGYGTAVGGFAGGLAGAAAGAAMGSVVPVIGTAIGGLIGGVLGSMGGENLGGWLAKVWAAETKPDQPGNAPDKPKDRASLGEAARSLVQPAEQPALATAATASVPVAAPAAPINQQFTFTANMPVTVNNSLDDPVTLQRLEAIARRQLEELMRQARSVQLLETPHIAL
ncbi:hypothetical protein CCOS865_04405 [Pseudomonas reidholzensis]|uniref:Tail tape measure protein n=1 Tax=Pseudomonas reidholzensis TaxID=1785162 RepID=A0A383RYD4_9PSED|nr:hypothetical protein [Pseudomonas reidholzensis]SYX92120.1 hypothetical protein CCOS865_04405 [Pseudomonas reidholzensis]